MADQRSPQQGLTDQPKSNPPRDGPGDPRSAHFHPALTNGADEATFDDRQPSDDLDTTPSNPNTRRNPRSDATPTAPTVNAHNKLTIITPPEPPTLTPPAARALLKILLAAAHSNGLDIHRNPHTPSKEQP